MFITVITPTYNSEKFLHTNILSVLQQSHKNIEHLFIDNNSTDKTIKIISNYKKKAKYKVKLFSKKDKGIYYAFNKGLNLAKGEIITILNSDDYFFGKDVFKFVIKTLKKKIDFIYGNVSIVARNNPKILIRKWKSEQIKNNEFYKIPHPSFFFKKQLIKKNKILFNTDFKIASDLDFIIKCCKSSMKYSYINKNLVIQRSGGISQSTLGIFLALHEVFKILSIHKINFKVIFMIKKLFYKICQLF